MKTILWPRNCAIITDCCLNERQPSGSVFNRRSINLHFSPPRIGLFDGSWTSRAELSQSRECINRRDAFASFPPAVIVNSRRRREHENEHASLISLVFASKRTIATWCH